jgi:hypothetical protein
MAQRKPIFQLKADCDATTFTNIKIQQTYADGSTIKGEVPTMDGASIEAVLYCIREFQETADELDYNTGAELFTNFHRVL